MTQCTLHRYGDRYLDSTECTFTTGWRRLIECLELQVIFCKRAINYRTLLREMTCEDTASHAVIFATLHSDRYGDSTECTFNVHSICSKQT